ncbi:LysR family transcriptional regulator [Acuticoccus kandeliae]|uniref:LysR family transcriptional regulator n=1 Tax=Acuticoccus kandeliae TaxID=2073160 RepID=UPI000D3E36A9|nr:LysR family transcriptional regulator [Acuticoccus kandeliae]
MGYDRIRALEVFVRVAELGSFTRAAHDLGMTQPAVTRSVKALEARLGAQLIQRTTRAIALSDDGVRFYNDARGLLEAFDEAEARVGRRAAAPSGAITVAAPTAFARLVLAPLLGPFMRAHPLVTLQLRVEDRVVDLVEGGIDVAFRLGALPDSGMRARKVCDYPRRAYAAPDFVARFGAPARPADLADLNCIVLGTGRQPARWTFTGPDGTETVAVGGTLRCDGTDIVRAATLDGIGVSYHPHFLFADALAEGRIVPLLTDYEGAPVPLNAVFPAGRFIAARTNAFVDHVAEAIRAGL